MKHEQATERFLRVATDLVVEACLKSGRAPPGGGPGGEEKNKVPAKPLSYAVVDAYVKLVLMLVRCCLLSFVVGIGAAGTLP